jgi:hypothetical protein
VRPSTVRCSTFRPRLTPATAIRIRRAWIKAYLIAQSLNQLQAAYGQSNSILDNCHVRMTYTATDDQTAKRVSNLVGQATHVKLQRTFSGGGWFRRVNQSEQEHARPLLTPDEILRLPFDDALLFVGGVAPYRARKLMYYLDPRFKLRVRLPPPDSARQQRHELLPRRQRSPWEQLLPAPAPPPRPTENSGGNDREVERPELDTAATATVPPGASPGTAVSDLPISANTFAELFGKDARSAPSSEPGLPSPASSETDGREDLPL